AIITGIAFGSFRLLSGTSTKEEIAKETTIPATTQPSSPNNEAIVSTPVEQPDPEQEARNDAALEESKQLFASLDLSDKRRISSLSEEHLLAMADPISAAANINPDNTYRDPQCTYVNSPSFALNEDNSPIDMANRYVMLMTPDGHFIRISKKLGPLVCCVSGEEADEDCNNQMKKWREKLASPSAGTSSGNFLELLHLIHNFKENNPE
ncbi:MAG TPA: anti-sigma factor domain-containing protein, partial [Chitinophagaceae bacterium]